MVARYSDAEDAIPTSKKDETLPKTFTQCQVDGPCKRKAEENRITAKRRRRKQTNPESETLSTTDTSKQGKNKPHIQKSEEDKATTKRKHRTTSTGPKSKISSTPDTSKPRKYKPCKRKTEKGSITAKRPFDKTPLASPKSKTVTSTDSSGQRKYKLRKRKAEGDDVTKKRKHCIPISASFKSKRSSTGDSCKRGNYKLLSVKKKLNIVAYAHKHGVRVAARAFKIGKSSVQSWMKVDFKKRRNARGLLVSSGRPLSYSKEVDDQICSYILERHDLQNAVSMAELCRYAKSKIKPSVPNFKASRSWAEKFMRRHKLVLNAKKSEDSGQSLTNTREIIGQMEDTTTKGQHDEPKLDVPELETSTADSAKQGKDKPFKQKIEENDAIAKDQHNEPRTASPNLEASSSDTPNQRKYKPCKQKADKDEATTEYQCLEPTSSSPELKTSPTPNTSKKRKYKSRKGKTENATTTVKCLHRKPTSRSSKSKASTTEKSKQRKYKPLKQKAKKANTTVKCLHHKPTSASPKPKPLSTGDFSKRGKYKQFSVKEKLDIAAYARTHGVRVAARAFKIGKSTVQSWMTIDFKEQRDDRGHLRKSGRPLTYPKEMDDQICSYILQNALSVDELCSYAKSKIKPSVPDFEASRSWAVNFMRRHKLVLRNGKIHTCLREMDNQMDDTTAEGQHDEQRTASPKSKELSPNSSKRGNYKQFSVKEKLDIVEYARTHGVRAAARAFKIGKSTVQSWMTIDFKEQRDDRGHLVRSGRPLSYSPEMDIQICSYVLEQRNLQKALTVEELRRYAKSKIKPSVPDFKASRSWAENFMRRHNLVLHRKTSEEEQ